MYLHKSRRGYASSHIRASARFNFSAERAKDLYIRCLTVEPGVQLQPLPGPRREQGSKHPPESRWDSIFVVWNFNISHAPAPQRTFESRDRIGVTAESPRRMTRQHVESPSVEERSHESVVDRYLVLLVHSPCIFALCS